MSTYRPLISDCCLGFPDGPPCGKPLKFYALAAVKPEDWGSDRYSASLGGYCCREHAEAEPRPRFTTAERVYRVVLDQTGCRCVAPEYICGCANCEAVTVWQRLLETYPNPVPVGAET